jgi:hypothetical protein
LLEPPKYYYSICNTRLVGGFIDRKYSTRTKTRVEQARLFYTQNKKLVWVTVAATGALLTSLGQADSRVADLADETTKLARWGDLHDLGVYTSDPKIRRRVRSLARYKGIDAQDLTFPDSKELDPDKVNLVYEEQCWTPEKRHYKNLVKSLEAEVESQNVNQARLEAQAARLEAQAARLEARLEAQAARLEAQAAELEKLKRTAGGKEKDIV